MVEPDAWDRLQDRQQAALAAVLAAGGWMARATILKAMLEQVPIGYTTLQRLLEDAQQQGLIECRRQPVHQLWRQCPDVPDVSSEEG